MYELLEIVYKTQINFVNVFEDNKIYIFCSKSFYDYFGEVPDAVELRGVDFKKAKQWIEKELADQIHKKKTREVLNLNIGKRDNLSVLFVMKNKMLIEIQNDEMQLFYVQKNHAKIRELIDKMIPEIRATKKITEKPKTE
ncbi:MAG: hypothetical protein ABI199_04385 [Bacteroidia bacterium]